MQKYEMKRLCCCATKSNKLEDYLSKKVLCANDCILGCILGLSKKFVHWRYNFLKTLDIEMIFADLSIVRALALYRGSYMSGHFV